ncbi:hypothetical protein NO2_1601 [Candidatus Termititenax persephonae]|uniref:Glycosyl transferase GTB-type super family n=1 Tax=Candidatus Termititenax persephonae TaxID=2218525 RepID=A0A388TK03_9BACT|nr:hypothetical protein NO2_1601 [Candidatus Termititenax persephonae]
MRILFISHGLHPDYQNDTVFHGLKALYGKNVSENVDLWYMYSDIATPEKAELPCSKGFTLYGNLSPRLKNIIPPREIQNRLKTHYFDYIIYGSIRHCHAYFGLVQRYYAKEKIIFIDGDDRTNVYTYFLNKGFYFKRELTTLEKKPDRAIFPISFGIPKEKILKQVPPKTIMLANSIPGELSTYIYNQEKDYYADYAKSCFALTKKKGGWDCLRHYEILANGCIPLFIDLASCPAETLHAFPKKQILHVKRLFARKILTAKEIHDLAVGLLNYTRRHLTTERVARYLLTAVKNGTIGKHHFSLYTPFTRIIYKILNAPFKFVREFARRRLNLPPTPETA